MCMLIGQFLFVGSLSGILQAASNQLNRLSAQQLMQTGSQLGSFVPGSKDGTGSGGQFASNGGENRIDSNAFTSQVQMYSYHVRLHVSVCVFVRAFSCFQNVCILVASMFISSDLHICVSAEKIHFESCIFHKFKQWRSQKAEKTTHIKGELLDQAVILFICVPFRNGNFS